MKLSRDFNLKRMSEIRHLFDSQHCISPFKKDLTLSKYLITPVFIYPNHSGKGPGSLFFFGVGTK
ncbi:MAG: hypothetical protein CMQ40_08945 [Gammaproteobacteria bacterium]|nr:hypothetical protein [Gammaproteobacteria bacterium]